MKTLIAVALMLLIAGSAFAMTDFGCVSRCTAQGNMWGLCNDRCSW